MKKYIKPEIKVQLIELENCILAGSISVGTDDDPATGPALSKGNNFFDDEDYEENYGAPRRTSTSLWDD